MKSDKNAKCIGQLNSSILIHLGQSTQEEFVDQLEQNMGNPDQLIHVLERLKVSLSTYYISWVQKFAEKGGHRKLNKVLNKWSIPSLKDESKIINSLVC